MESIVRGQVSSHSHHETSSNSGNSEPRNDQSNTNATQDVLHENQEGGVQLPDRVENTDDSTAVQSTHQHVPPDQGMHWQGQITEDERQDVHQSALNDSNGWRHDISDDTGRIRQENTMSDWPSGSEDAGQHRSQQPHEVWPDDGSREAVDNWSEGPSDPPRMRRSIPFRRVPRFHLPDDDNVYSMELRELLSRLLSHFLCANFLCSLFFFLK